MERTRNPKQKRRGAIAPLAAVMATLLVGMLAFAIDTGYIVAVRAELQNAADAAALAGVQRLQEPFVQFYSPGQTDSGRYSVYNAAITDATTATSPICTAKQFSRANKAGNVSVAVNTPDISFSYWDGTHARVPASYPANFPNSVTVVTRRDASANGSLGLFFGRVLGLSSVNLTATATATMFAGDVNSLQVIPGVNAHILPVALDVNFWKNYASTGKSPDGTVKLGTNGLPQLQVYPYFKDAPGAFGLLDVGAPANNTPAFRSWIDNGETPNDIKYLVDNHLVPVSMDSPQQWKCGPGLKSTLVSDFQSVIGEPNLLPLFKPVVAYNASNPSSYQAATGNGQNTTFAIVGFVGVTVSKADGSGNSGLTICVQPMATLDPTEVIGSPHPVTPTSLTQFNTYQTTFLAAKLTQ